MTVIERITRLIEKRNWSVYQLAKRSGISQSTITNMERRKSGPSVSTLAKICDALGISLSQFFDYDNQHVQEMLTPEQKDFWEEWISLTREQQEKVKSFIYGMKS